MSIINWIVVLFFLIIPASAVTIDNPYHVYQVTKSNISFPTSQTYDSIELGTNNIKLNGDLFQITPSGDWVNVSMILFNDAAKSYTADAPASYDIGGFAPTHKIYITVDGSVTGSTDSNAAGQIIYNQVSSGSHTLRFDAASAPSPQLIVINTTGQNLQWWVLLMIFLGVIGVVLNLGMTNKNRIGIIVALTVMVIAIGIAVGTI